MQLRVCGFLSLPTNLVKIILAFNKIFPELIAIVAKIPIVLWVRTHIVFDVIRIDQVIILSSVIKSLIVTLEGVVWPYQAKLALWWLSSIAATD
jgi:hypothetical protein